MTHYRSAKRLPSGLEQALLRGASVQLGMLQGRDEAYTLVISRALTTRQEGEICIQMQDGQGHSLGKISFTMIGERGGVSIVIGGLQGLNRGGDKAWIVRSTRQLSGLRPKAALLVAVPAFADAMAAQRILAVGQSHSCL